MNLKKGTVNGSLVDGTGFTVPFYVFYAPPKDSGEEFTDRLLDHLKIVFGNESLKELVEDNKVYDKYMVIPSDR